MQHPRDLLVVETAKVSQLDYLAATWIAFSQSLKCFVQQNQFAALIRSDCSNFLERDLLRAATSLCVSMSSRVIDQDASHDLGGDREEVGAIRPVHILLIDQTDVRFIYQSSGLKCMVFSLLAHVTAGEAMELVIDQRVQLVQSGLVSFAPLSEQFSNLMSGWTLQCLSGGKRATDSISMPLQTAPISPGLRNILLTSPTWSSSSAIIRRA